MGQNPSYVMKPMLMTKIQWEADIAECDQKLFLFSYIVKIMMSLSDNKSLAQSLQIFVITLRQLKKKRLSETLNELDNEYLCKH